MSGFPINSSFPMNSRALDQTGVVSDSVMGGHAMSILELVARDPMIMLEAGLVIVSFLYLVSMVTGAAFPGTGLFRDFWLRNEKQRAGGFYLGRLTLATRGLDLDGPNGGGGEPAALPAVRSTVRAHRSVSNGGWGPSVVTEFQQLAASHKADAFGSLSSAAVASRSTRAESHEARSHRAASNVVRSEVKGTLRRNTEVKKAIQQSIFDNGLAESGRTVVVNTNGRAPRSAEIQSDMFIRDIERQAA